MASDAPPHELLVLSRSVGENRLLVQGAGGNTSFKSGDAMWVKASGTRLAEAEERAIFVAVDVGRAVAEIDGAGDGTCCGAMIDPSGPLRPSIETAFHALLPQRWVVHVHSIATLAHATSPEGRAALASKLAGLDWCWVDYRKPGVPLTRAIRERLKADGPLVFVLANHGLIVCGEEAAAVEWLLGEVEARLAMTPRQGEGAPALPAAPAGWHFIEAAGELGRSADMLRRATAASYYPDHVVFLGPGMGTATLEELRRPGWQAPRHVVLIEGIGTLAADTAPAGATAMAICLADLLARVPVEWRMTGIGGEAERELLDWDAEKYRQALGRRGA